MAMVVVVKQKYLIEVMVMVMAMAINSQHSCFVVSMGRRSKVVEFLIVAQVEVAVGIDLVVAFLHLFGRKRQCL